MRWLKKAGGVLLMITLFVGLNVGGGLLFVAVLRLAPQPAAHNEPLPDFDDGYEACRTDPACH